ERGIALLLFPLRPRSPRPIRRVRTATRTVRALCTSPRQRRVGFIQVVFRGPEHRFTFRAADLFPVEHLVRHSERGAALGTSDLHPGHDLAFESENGSVGQSLYRANDGAAMVFGGANDSWAMVSESS